MDKVSQEKVVRSVYEIVENANMEKHIGNTDFKVSINVSRNKLPLPANTMVFQTFAHLAATKLLPVTNKVLMLFFSITEYENFISMDVKTIAEKIGQTERNIFTAIKELIDNNIIIKIQHPSDKRRNDYFMNPLAAWRGNSFSRDKKIKATTKENINQLDLKFDKTQEKHSLLPCLKKTL